MHYNNLSYSMVVWKQHVVINNIIHYQLVQLNVVISLTGGLREGRRMIERRWRTASRVYKGLCSFYVAFLQSISLEQGLLDDWKLARS